MSLNARDKQIAERDNIATQSYVSREQQISVTDLICEGPIEGLVQGTASVHLNDDPIILEEKRSYSPDIDNMQITVTTSSTSATLNTAIADLLPEERRKIVLRKVKSTTDIAITVTNSSEADNTASFKLVYGDDPLVDPEFFNSSWMYARTKNRARLIADRDLWGSKVQAQAVEGVLVKKLGTNTVEFQCTTVSANEIKRVADASLVDTYRLEIDYVTTMVSGSGTSATLFQAVPFSGTFNADVGQVYIDSSYADKFVDTENLGKYGSTTVQFRPGTRNQSPMTNFGMGTAAVRISNNPTANSLEFIDANSEDPNETPAAAPIFRGTSSGGFNLSTAQAREIDEVRMTFTYNSLFNQNTRKGVTDIAGAAYKIDLKLYRGTTTSDVTLEERRVHFAEAKSNVVFEEIINLEPFKPFDDFEIKVTRLTRHNGLGVSGDTLSNYGRNKNTQIITGESEITSVTAIIKEQLNYPYTAVSNITFSSKNFQSIPTRSYHLRGLKVRVPSNYTTREQRIANNLSYDVGDLYDESPVWDGGLSTDLVWTDNPAWIFYDILTNDRYGLGAYLKEYDIDKYALYRIGKYCDELVDDGKGGQEPRYRANIFLQKQADAYKVLKDFATSFLGLIYWLDGKVMPVADQSGDNVTPIYTFSKANVIDGAFEYEGTGQKTRANQIVVNWVNPENNYKQEVLIVEDRKNIAETGKVVKEDATAFGCTSEGQAIRYGRWKLFTAVNQTEIVSFKTSINAAFLMPGDVIKIQDADKFNLAYSGKVTGTPTTTTIPLDRSITLNFGSTYHISVLLGDDQSGDEQDAQQRPIKVETQQISTSAGTVSSLTVGTAFSEAPKAGSVFVIREETSNGLDSSASAKDYRIIGISEDSANEYTITAVEYISNKFETIENEFTLVTPDTVYPRIESTQIPLPPKNVYVEFASDYNKAGDEFKILWELPDDDDSITGFEIYHNIPGYDNPIELSGTKITSYKFEGVPDMTGRVAVRTVNTVNNRSAVKSVVFKVRDIYRVACPREAEGLPVGALVTSGLELSSSYVLQFKSSTIGIATAANPADVYTKTSNLPTLNTVQSSIADGTYFVLFDRSAEALKPIRHKVNTALGGISYWYDDTVNEFNNQTGTVSVAASSTKVLGTGTSFTSEFEVGDIIKFSSTQAAKVSYIESDTTLFIDRSFNSAISGVTPARQSLRIDFIEDCIVGKVIKSGSTSTFQTLVQSGLEVSSLSDITSDLGTVSSGSFGGTVTGTVTGTIDGATIENSTITGSTFDGTAKLIVQEDSTQESNEITTLNFTTGINVTTSSGVATISVDAADNVLTNEQVQDIVGAMVTGNSESGITVTYQDDDGTLDFSVASQTDNNFTTTLKNKLDNIEANANNYSLPTATASVLGGIKVGSNLTITDGVLSADTQAGTYTLPTASASVLGGIKVGSNLSIDGSGVLSSTDTTYTAGNGLTLTGTEFTLVDPDTLDQLTESTDNAFDKILLWDSSSDVWKYMTMEDLQDSIDTSVANTDTTYDLAVPESTTKIRLSGSDATSDDIEIAGSGATTVTRDSANKLIISSTDNNTTYSNATTSEDGLMSSEDKTKLDGVATNANNYSLPTNNVTNASVSGNTLTLTRQGTTNVTFTNTNTTYDAATSSTLGLLKIGYSENGKNYPVEFNASNQAFVNVPWTDTDTTYSAGNGITLTGTSFSVDAHNPSTTNVTVSVGGDGVYADVKDGGIENVHLAVDTISLDKIAISEFPTVVWKTKYTVRDGSPDSNGEYEVYEGGAFTDAADTGENWSSITGIRLYETDGDGRNLAALLGELIANKSYIRLKHTDDNWGTYKVSSISDDGVYWSIGLTDFNKSATGTYSTTTPLYVEFQVKTDAIVDGNLIVQGTVTADAIAANTITASEIAANTLTADQIAANAITASEISAGAVNANEIAANAITAAKITTGTITASEIAANAITASEISAGAVSANEIAANAITTAKIAADAVTADSIASNAVTADQVAANAITAASISAGAITASEIGANAITAAKIKAGAVSASEIAANAITAVKIAANAVTADQVAANAVTANEIAANAVTATQIQANSITAASIAANAISASEISANAVTATQIKANSITAASITAGTIGASEIAANAITAAKIQAGTITASEIAANAITANKIAANAVTADQVAANAITASQIAAGAITASDITTGTLDANSVTVSNLRADDISGGVSEIFEQSFVVPAGQSVSTAFTTIVDLDLQAPQHNISKYFTVQGLFGFYIQDSSGSVQVGNIILDVQRKSKGTGTAGAINLGTQVDVGTAGSFNYWVEVSGNKTADINYFAKLSKVNTGMYAKNITGVRYIASTNRTRIFYSDSSQHYTSGNNHSVWVSPDAWALTGTWVSTGRGQDSFMVTTENYSTITNTFAYIGSYGVFDGANEFRIQAKTQSLSATTTFRRFVGTAEYKV